MISIEGKQQQHIDFFAATCEQLVKIIKTVNDKKSLCINIRIFCADKIHYGNYICIGYKLRKILLLP